MLTGREHEVLHLVAHGLRTPAIAATLGVAESTVQSFVRAAKQKLGVRTRAQAALLAVGPESSPAGAALDEEQRRLLELIARGQTVDVAARELNISLRTAYRSLAEIRACLGVPTTAAAIAWKPKTTA